MKYSQEFMMISNFGAQESHDNKHVRQMCTDYCAMMSLYIWRIQNYKGMTIVYDYDRETLALY